MLMIQMATTLLLSKEQAKLVSLSISTSAPSLHFNLEFIYRFNLLAGLTIADGRLALAARLILFPMGQTHRAF